MLTLNERQVVVHSHERSGTHFLMNTLADNFGYQSHPWIDLNLTVNPWTPFYVAKEFEKITMRNTPNIIVKSHYEGTFFKEFNEKIFKYFTFLYIYRDSNDALESCRGHFKNLRWNEAPKKDDMQDFMKAEPSGGCLRYQYKQYPTMSERYKGHLDSWFDGFPEDIRKYIIYVKFEDLRDNFESTVKEIESQLDRKMLWHTPKKPDKGRSVQNGKFLVGVA